MYTSTLEEGYTLEPHTAQCQVQAASEHSLACSLCAAVRDVEDDVVPVCRELGIGIVAFSPLGKGMLTGEPLWGLVRANLVEPLPNLVYA